MRVCVRTMCCLRAQNAVITFAGLLAAMISFASNTNPDCLCVKMSSLPILWESRANVRAHSTLFSLEEKEKNNKDFELLVIAS